ncbi:MAG: hypothetical protein F4Y49_12890 [Dehalococcoidia bacterium]|nr:hypothetical protein [Dehalococcoidia bacterium]
MLTNVNTRINQPHEDNSDAADFVIGPRQMTQFRELHDRGAWLIPLKADRTPAVRNYYRRRLSWTEFEKILQRDTTVEIAIAYLDKLGIVCVDADEINNLVRFVDFLKTSAPLGYVVSTPPNKEHHYGKYHIFYLNGGFKAVRKGITDVDGGWSGEVITGKGLLRISSEEELDEIIRIVKSINMMSETERLLTRHRLPNYADKAKYPSTRAGSGAGEWVGDYREIYTLEERSEIGKRRGHASGNVRRQNNYSLTKPWWCQHYHQSWSHSLIAQRFGQSRQRVWYHLSKGLEYEWREANGQLVKDGECVHGCPKLLEREEAIWSERTRRGEEKRREYRKEQREQKRQDRENARELGEMLEADKGAISSFDRDIENLPSLDDLIDAVELPPIKEGRKLTPYGRLTRRWSLTRKRTGYRRVIDGIGGATAWRRTNDDAAAVTLFLRNPYLAEIYGETVYCNSLYDLYERLEEISECHGSSSLSQARMKPVPVPPHLAYLEYIDLTDAVARLHAEAQQNRLELERRKRRPELRFEPVG